MKESSFLTHTDELRGRPHGETGVERLANFVPRRDRSGKSYYQCPATFVPFQIEGATFPFPQVVRGIRKTFVLTGDRIGYLDESSGTGSWFPFVGVAFTGAWSVADKGDVWVLMNPSYTAYHDANGDYLYPTPVFACCCFDGDRFIAANNTDRRIYWGSPAGDDISVMLGVSGATRTTNQLNREDFNSAACIFQGNILALRKLGDAIVVYGADGINILRQNDMMGYDPYPVAGISSNVGLKSAMSVTGNIYGHVFIGSDGVLYSLSPDGKCDRIGEGYREFISALTSPVLSQDPEEGDVWIVDASSSYCLTEAGLGGPLDIAPYSSALLSDGTILRTGRAYTSDAVIFEVVSAAFDFGESGCQAITEMQIGADEFHHLRGGFYYRISTREAWRRTSRLIPFSPEGFAPVPLQCVQGKAIFSGTLANLNGRGKVRRMEVRYQITDRRGRRGTKILGGGLMAAEE